MVVSRLGGLSKSRSRSTAARMVKVLLGGFLGECRESGGCCAELEVFYWFYWIYLRSGLGERENMMVGRTQYFFIFFSLEI